jgi:hypothetical protein
MNARKPVAERVSCLWRSCRDSALIRWNPLPTGPDWRATGAQPVRGDVSRRAPSEY